MIGAHANIFCWLHETDGHCMIYLLVKQQSRTFCTCYKGFVLICFLHFLLYNGLFNVSSLAVINKTTSFPLENQAYSFELRFLKKNFHLAALLLVIHLGFVPTKLKLHLQHTYMHANLHICICLYNVFMCVRKCIDWLIDFNSM